MPKNVPVQNYEALKLVSFPRCRATHILKLTNMKSFVTVGKSIKNLTENAGTSMPKMDLPNVMRRCFPTLLPGSFGFLNQKPRCPGRDVSHSKNLQLKLFRGTRSLF